MFGMGEGVKADVWGAMQVLTCHQVPDEEDLVLFVVLQHALEVLLFPLDCDLPGELMLSLVTLGQCLGSWVGKG
jgi:hypothetical protein